MDGVSRNVGNEERNRIIAASHEASEAINGQTGFIRLDQTTPGTTNEYDAAENDGNEVVAIMAMNGSATFGAGCTAARGDAPATGDVLADGAVLRAPLTNVVLSAGEAYVFVKQRLADN